MGMGLLSSNNNSLQEETIHLISSLITLSLSVKVFSLKWQSITHLLQQLLSSLSPTSFNNPPPCLHSIATTLHHCHQLATTCLHLSYSGKLLMMSDLDIMCATLTNHIKDLSHFHYAHHPHAIVLSKPLPGSSTDAINIYIGDLFSRLKIGTPLIKTQALITLNQLFQQQEEDHDLYITIAATQVDSSFILILIGFLESPHSPESSDDEKCLLVQEEEAIKALFFIARYVHYRNALIVSGILAPLVRLLDCGSHCSKRYAARCLLNLTENSDNAWSVSAHGGVTSLLKICSNTNTKTDGGGNVEEEEEEEELVSSACGVLKNLVGVEEIKRFMVEQGAIPCFINLVENGNAGGGVLICSIDLLQTMGAGDDSIKSIIVKEGGANALVRVLDPKRMLPTKAKQVALKGIMSLRFCFNYTLSMLLSYGFLDHVLYSLGFGEVGVQELALKASFWLCGTSEEAKKAMGDAGLMHQLVKFLDSYNYSLQVREMAAETLYCLTLIPKNRKRFVLDDENVGLILQVLDKEGGGGGDGGGNNNNQKNNNKLLLTLIMSLTGSNSARKKIVNSGYLKKIEKLADSENDAKKIVKKLRSNRLRNLFNGIWH